jgi:hypothetical protein
MDHVVTCFNRVVTLDFTIFFEASAFPFLFSTHPTTFAATLRHALRINDNIYTRYHMSMVPLSMSICDPILT